MLLQSELDPTPGERPNVEDPDVLLPLAPPLVVDPSIELLVVPEVPPLEPAEPEPEAPPEPPACASCRG
jgi:hypothetical protein